ncbi:putative RNA-directed DNA polymerase [Helianthus annuus]|nr:putative RNA-directed DNA polymerase [Helianthus annuus]
MTGGVNNESVKTDATHPDHNSPYYLHPSDYPRQMHVNDALTYNNYLDWVQEMENFLFAKNKIGFIDGTIKRPETGDAKYMAWMRCDAMIKGWLTTAMEKEIRGSVKYANSASEIWKDLKERFGKESAPRAYELKQAISNTKQEGMTVSAYYTKLRGLWDEIQSFLPTPICKCSGCTCDIGKTLRELKEKEQLYEFLMGLDGEFSIIRTQILATKPIPSLGNAYHLVAEDEQQRAITGVKKPVNETMAFQTSMKRGGPSSRIGQKENKNVAHCDHCGRDGHTRDGCFKIVGYPEWWNVKNKREKAKPKAACAETEPDPIASLTREQYEQFQKLFAAENKPAQSEPPRTANMAGKFKHDEEWGLRSRKLIGAGRCKDGLYQMGMLGTRRKAMMVTSDLWHKRLGHAGDEKLSQINFLSNFSFKNSDNICDSCMKSKFTKLPFPTSTTKTNACFDLIHCDIWGRYRTPSFTKANYFLTIVDDFSRSIWVYLLKHKFEASTCLMHFHKMVKTQFEKNIKRIRCDNGGEFISNKMVNFYDEEGIMLETTCPHTPQQNGIVERKHRHLLDTARALMFEAKLPKRFWGECVLTATYIINRLPSKVIKDKTPYELLHGEKPSYDHMRVLGCLAYYRSIETNGDKFEIRGRPGVFMGYPIGTKGYKIYDPNNGKIITSRDVKFAERVFPFATKFEQGKREGEDVFTSFMDEENGPSIPNMPSTENLGPNGPEAHQNEEEELEELNQYSPSNDTGPILDGPDVFFQSQIPDEPPVCESQNQSNEGIAQGREKRTRTRPAHLKDYDVKLPTSLDHAPPASDQGSSTVCPIANFVSYDKFSKPHKAFLAAITENDEPKSFKQAVQDQHWRDAMQKEIKALEENGTWTIEDLPSGKRVIDSKWVYKTKFKPNGEVERYKARLVAKGYTQMEGVDYHDTFAPVAKLVTVRSLIAIAIKRDWSIHQLDVNNAFLHGDLHEEVYMRIPQGYDKGGGTKVCRLRKSLYGLKQASRNWYQKFTSALLQLNYKQSAADHSLFIYKEGKVFVTALIYVDDVIVVGNNEDKIKETKKFLNDKFSIKDLGPLKYFLGIEAARTKDGIVLSQRKYTLDILEDSGMLGCRPCTFPMEPNMKLDKGEDNARVDASKYRRLVGRLLYLQATRPDLAYSVNVLSQFVSDPRQKHMDAAMRVLRYLKATPGQGIFFPKEGGTDLVAYCDADWMGCSLTRRSRTGYVLLLGGAPISWKSKKQSVVSRSSAEAEYRAMANATSEILWMRWLLEGLETKQHDSTPLYCDNNAARHIANNPVFHERTKHVEMDCYFVKERVESHEIKPLYVDTKAQIADLLTKALGTKQLEFLLVKMGMRNLHAPP